LFAEIINRFIRHRVLAFLKIVFLRLSQPAQTAIQFLQLENQNVRTRSTPGKMQKWMPPSI
jgi:hypothetical protein